jgi:hypothetical protein
VTSCFPMPASSEEDQSGEDMEQYVTEMLRCMRDVNVWGFHLGDNENKRRRYCLMCNVFKPERCHHCSACNRCVLNMDHHCPWINNCVGFWNRK